MVQKSILLIAMLNNNHLSNVRTLQSIYSQTHPEIYLVICNDAIPKFDCELIIYNLFDKPDNIKGIYLKENRYPLGEFLSQQQFFNKVNTQYVFTIHSGEYFISHNSLESLVNEMERQNDAVAICCHTELWSNDMRTRLNIYPDFDLGSDGKLSISVLDYNSFKNLRDCMFLYKLSVIKNLKYDQINWNAKAYETIIPKLLNSGYKIACTRISICKYSLESIKQIEVKIPESFGNNGLQLLKEKLKKSELNESQFYIEYEAIQQNKKKKNNKISGYINKFFTTKRIISLFQLAVLLTICAILLLYLKKSIFTIISIPFFVIATIIYLSITYAITSKIYIKYFNRVSKR